MRSGRFEGVVRRLSTLSLTNLRCALLLATRDGLSFESSKNMAVTAVYLAASRTYPSVFTNSKMFLSHISATLAGKLHYYPLDIVRVLVTLQCTKGFSQHQVTNGVRKPLS